MGVRLGGTEAQQGHRPGDAAYSGKLRHNILPWFLNEDDPQGESGERLSHIVGSPALDSRIFVCGEGDVGMLVSEGEGGWGR